jgi:hypothetical protein
MISLRLEELKVVMNTEKEHVNENTKIGTEL